MDTKPARVPLWQAPVVLSSIKTDHINIQIGGYVGAVSKSDSRIWLVTGDEIVEQAVCQFEAKVMSKLISRCSEVAIVGCNWG